MAILLWQLLETNTSRYTAPIWGILSLTGDNPNRREICFLSAICRGLLVWLIWHAALKALTGPRAPWHPKHVFRGYQEGVQWLLHESSQPLHEKPWEGDWESQASPGPELPWLWVEQDASPKGLLPKIQTQVSPGLIILLLLFLLLCSGIWPRNPEYTERFTKYPSFSSLGQVRHTQLPNWQILVAANLENVFTFKK